MSLDLILTKEIMCVNNYDVCMCVCVFVYYVAYNIVYLFLCCRKGGQLSTMVLKITVTSA